MPIDDDSARHVTQLDANADRLTGLSLTRLGYDDEEPDPDARALSLRRTRLLAGAIWQSCSSLLDDLFSDLRQFDESGHMPADAPTLAIDELPQRFAPYYSQLFVQQFLTVAVDLGHQLVGGFTHPSCVAQELALRLVLNRAEEIEDLWQLDLIEDWRGFLEDALFPDADHELLYDWAFDGLEESPIESLGMADMRFEHWFTPFTNAIVNPYAAPETD